MNKLEIFYLRVKVTYKKKNWFTKKETEHTELLDYDLICLARNKEQAVEKYKKAYKVENLKEYVRESRGGYDHDFTLNAYMSDWITFEDLAKAVPADEMVEYINQTINPKPARKRR